MCGSVRSYADCCRRKHLWHPVCPNLGAEGYSLTKPQSLTFHNVDGDVVHQRLMADPQVRCTDTRQDDAFWVFHGDLPVEEQYGILCFSDLELKYNRTLIVSAMSEPRVQALLAFLQEINGEFLGKPHIRQDPVCLIDTRTGKAKKVKSSDRPPKRKPRRKWRR